ncbi:MAG: hypothetical protein V3T51_06070, partial [Gammaproteobacteria bacterium]
MADKCRVSDLAGQNTIGMRRVNSAVPGTIGAPAGTSNNLLECYRRLIANVNIAAMALARKQIHTLVD